MARVNIDILGIGELKWTGMGECNSDDHNIYYCGQESLRRNGSVLIVNKRVQNAVLGCNLKNDRMISVHFQGKPFNITVIQVYAPTSNAEECRLPCCIFSYVVGRGCLLWTVCSLGKTLLAFALLHSIFQGQICLLSQVFLDFLLLHSSTL